MVIFYTLRLHSPILRSPTSKQEQNSDESFTKLLRHLRVCACSEWGDLRSEWTGLRSVVTEELEPQNVSKKGGPCPAVRTK